MKYFYPYSVVMCASTVHLIYANTYFLIFGSTFPVCQIENNHMQFLQNKYSHSHYWIIIYFITTSLFQIVKSLHCNYLTHKCLDSFFRSFSGHSLRYALFVYRLIGSTFIGNFLMITSQIKNQNFCTAGRNIPVRQ